VLFELPAQKAGDLLQHSGQFIFHAGDYSQLGSRSSRSQTREMSSRAFSCPPTQGWSHTLEQNSAYANEDDWQGIVAIKASNIHLDASVRYQNRDGQPRFAKNCRSVQVLGSSSRSRLCLWSE
jgi:hypothetical protein